MFMDTSSFNIDISKWNTGRATSMSSMFYNASVFNAKITRWDVSKVMNMNFMFVAAPKFSQRLCWNYTGIFAGNYDQVSFDTYPECTYFHMTISNIEYNL